MFQLNLQPLLNKINRNKFWLYNQLNEISPISYTNFNNMFNNKTQSIRYSTLTHLCNIFDCEPTDLFTK